MKLLMAGLALCVAGAGLARAGDGGEAKAREGGRALFARHCASCHGTDGKGAGPAAAALKAPPPDLTRLPRKDGRFDADRARTFIDGTQAATAHGPRDMPVWGKVFAKAGARKGAGAAQTDVWMLVEHLTSLQEETAR
jgi:mono/diheme cytochrome c family protein